MDSSETTGEQDARQLAESVLQNELNVLHVRRVVAGNPNTPRQVLLRLAADCSVVIRSAVASNPKATIDMLEVMAHDISSEVRLAVAENTNTPWELLIKVASDADPDVRYGVAENPHIPDDVLLALIEDENPYVAWRAVRTLESLSPEAQMKVQLRLSQNASKHKMNA
jgi:HEAT repeat protein